VFSEVYFSFLSSGRSASFDGYGNYIDLGQFNDIRSFYQNDNGKQHYASVCIKFTCEYSTDHSLLFHLYGFYKNENEKEKYYHKLSFNIEFDAAGKDELLFHKEQFSPRIKSIEQIMDVTDNSGTIKKSMNITIPDVENKYNDPSIDMPFYHFWVGHEIDNNFDPIYYHSFESYFEARFIYVAPLRHHGTMYPLSKSSNYSDVGLNGEYTAAVFDSHFFIHVSYIPVKNLYSTGLEKSIIKRPLNEALKYWLNYLCVADDVKPELTKHGYELRTLTNINNSCYAKAIF